MKHSLGKILVVTFAMVIALACVNMNMIANAEEGTAFNSNLQWSNMGKDPYWRIEDGVLKSSESATPEIASADKYIDGTKSFRYEVEFSFKMTATQVAIDNAWVYVDLLFGIKDNSSIEAACENYQAIEVRRLPVESPYVGYASIDDSIKSNWDSFDLIDGQCKETSVNKMVLEYNKNLGEICISFDDEILTIITEDAENIIQGYLGFRSTFAFVTVYKAIYTELTEEDLKTPEPTSAPTPEPTPEETETPSHEPITEEPKPTDEPAATDTPATETGSKAGLIIGIVVAVVIIGVAVVLIVLKKKKQALI